MRIGLTGGIGSGKSTVAKILEECGCAIIDADVLARLAVAPGSKALAQIAERWPSVITASGELDRAGLGRIVFADEAARQQLNQIVHPVVRALSVEAEKHAASGQLVVHVVPLLFEEGFAKQCDYTVLVVAPDAERIQRVAERDGFTRDQVQARIARQMPSQQARLLANEVIENDADLAHLRRQTRELYTRLTSAHA